MTSQAIQSILAPRLTDGELRAYTTGEAHGFTVRTNREVIAAVTRYGVGDDGSASVREGGVTRYMARKPRDRRAYMAARRAAAKAAAK